jgi:hypothetical protein
MPRKSLHNNRKAEYIYPEITSRSYCEYDKTKCLLELYSAEHIIDRMKYDKYIITKILENKNSWKDSLDFNPLDKILSIDDGCLCAGGWGERPYVNKNFCVGCEILRRISKGIKTPEDGILYIETGKYLGSKYFITNVENFFSPFSLDEKSKKINDKLFLNVDLHINEEVIYYSTLSPISNYVCISSFIHNKLSKNHFPTIPLFEWAYQCNKNTIVIENYPNLGVGTLSNLLLKPEFNNLQVSPTAKKNQALSIKFNVVISILKQLVSTLHFLNNYGFSHGSPTLKYISFSYKPTHYKYEGADIISPITINLIPSYNASINIDKNIRIFNKNYLDIYTDCSMPIEKIDYFIGHKNTVDYQVPLTIIPMMKELDENLILGYKIGFKKNTFIDLKIKRGIDFFQSFDFYMFICSLLTEEAFYSTFIEHRELSSIWYNIWKSSEYEKITEVLRVFRSRETTETVSFEEIYESITNFTLREDAIDYFWNSIKNL